MASVSRDVLIVSRLSSMSEQALEQELHRVNQLLLNVETLHRRCLATEIIDVAGYKIIRKPHKVMDTLRKGHLKPFVFAFNRN